MPLSWVADIMYFYYLTREHCRSRELESNLHPFMSRWRSSVLTATRRASVSIHLPRNHKYHGGRTR